jgi:DNA recombination-dependent growth factor C
MSNPFKNFIPYSVSVKRSDGMPASAVTVLYNLDAEDIPDHMMTTDPTGGQWRTIGFAECHEGNVIHGLDGAGVLLAVQFNERILPGKVRDEHLAKRVAALTEMDGRKPGKKEYAQLRDQVEFELLPKSHIRRTTVYVLVTPENNALVFTSSAKKAEDAMALLGGLLNETHTTNFMAYQVKDGVIGWMNGIARDGDIEIDGPSFAPLNSAVLKKAKETIRLKDVEVDSDDVQTLLQDEYDVHELALGFYVDGDLAMTFGLTEKLIFKRVVFPDTVLSNSTDKGEDGKVAFHSFAWLVARQYRDLLKAITSELGGQVLQAPSEDTKTKPAADEDDEL